MVRIAEMILSGATGQTKLDGTKKEQYVNKEFPMLLPLRLPRGQSARI